MNFEEIIKLQAFYQKLADTHLELIRFYQQLKGDDYTHDKGEGYFIGRIYEKYRAKSDILKEIIEINNLPSDATKKI